jgi:hypothetical protein
MAGGSRARPALRGFSRGGRAAQARRAGKKGRNKKSVKSCESCLVKKHGFFRRPGGIASNSTGQAGGLNFFPSFWEGRKTKDKSSQSCRSCRTRSTQGPCFNTPNAQKFMTLCIARRSAKQTSITHLRQNAPCGSTGMNGVVTRHSFGEGGLLLRRVPPS